MVRRTLISSSVSTLRERGHFDAYVRNLPEAHHEAVLRTMTPSWIDISHAVAHYGAADALNLGTDELQAIGSTVGDRIQSTFLGTLARRARDVGAAPWLVLNNFQRLWERLMQGGATGVDKVGPKDVIIRIEGLPLSRYTYFRYGFVGVFQVGAGLLSRMCVVRCIESACDDDRLEYRISWV